MYSELVSLPGKAAGGLVIHSVIEISIAWAVKGGAIQLAPKAMIVELEGEVSTFLLTCYR